MSDYIAIGSLVVAIIAIVISLITNTKKYELTEAQRTVILNWYQSTVELLILIRLHLDDERFNRKEYLAKLSALIECGRFYFPNLDKGDNFGSEKPLAYKGYRDITLDFLIYSYDIFNRDDTTRYISHLENLQRLFTSRIYEILAPTKHNKLVKKNTIIYFDNRMSLEDYLKSDPKIDNFKLFI